MHEWGQMDIEQRGKGGMQAHLEGHNITYFRALFCDLRFRKELAFELHFEREPFKWNESVHLFTGWMNHEMHEWMNEIMKQDEFTGFFSPHNVKLIWEALENIYLNEMDLSSCSQGGPGGRRAGGEPVRSAKLCNVGLG